MRIWHKAVKWTELKSPCHLDCQSCHLPYRESLWVHVVMCLTRHQKVVAQPDVVAPRVCLRLAASATAYGGRRALLVSTCSDSDDCKLLLLLLNLYITIPTAVHLTNKFTRPYERGTPRPLRLHYPDLVSPVQRSQLSHKTFRSTPMFISSV